MKGESPTPPDLGAPRKLGTCLLSLFPAALRTTAAFEATWEPVPQMCIHVREDG